MNNLFKLTFDDSGFQKVFQTFETQLNRHEQMILELQKLLNSKIDKNDLDQALVIFKKDLNKEFTGKINELEQKINDRIDKLEKEFNEKIEQQIKGMEFIRESSEKINQLETEINHLKEEVSKTSQTVATNSVDIDKNRDYIQAMTDAYTLINNTKADLDSNISKTLNTTSNYLTLTLKQLSDGQSHLNHSLQTLIAKSKNVAPEQIMNNNVGTLIDLTHLEPRPNYSPSWKENPNLPSIRKFSLIEDAVDYLYDCVPKLQGYLTAMHGKVLENSSEIGKASSKEMLDKMLEKLRQAIQEVNREIGELRKSLGKGVSRSTVEEMISEALLNSPPKNDGGAVGAVKCIACGRELNQVTGAMSETEAIRRLGKPINSVAMYATQGYNYLGQLYSSPDLEKSDRIVESPRSTRTRASISVRRSRKERYSADNNY